MAKLTKKQLEYQTKKANELILNEVDKAMDLIEAHLKRYCTDVSMEAFGQPSISVPMIYISESIKIMKKSYREGVEGIKEQPKGVISHSIKQVTMKPGQYVMKDGKVKYQHSEIKTEDKPKEDVSEMP